MKRLATAAALALLCAAASCTKIPERYSPEPPRIILESDEPIYRIKVNEPLKLTPTVENAGDDAAYRWSIEGEVVGYEPTFTYVGTEAGSVYLLFEVINDSGQDEAEMRIDVMPYRFPAITLVVPANGYSLLRGEELTFSPEVDNAEVSAFEWKVNGTTVSATQEYTFRGEETGEYALSFTASNEDGTDSVAFTVRVCTEEQMAFDWRFEQTAYNVSVGRTVFIRPYYTENAFDAVYTWKVNGEPVEAPAVETVYAGPAPACILAFTPPSEGTYEVEAVMTNSYVERTQLFTVHCCPAEGTYRRTPSAASAAQWNKVYEFTAAPGQFVNEHYTAADPEAACAYADSRMREAAYVSLGAFGGCLVVGFDHSIENDGGYNIRGDGISRMYFEALAKKYRFKLDTPVKDLSPEVMDVILYGTRGEELTLHYDQPRGKGTLHQAFEGICNNLERRYKETQSDAMRRELEECMSECPCPTCRGRRLKKESLAVTVGGLDIELLAAQGEEALSSWAPSLVLQTQCSVPLTLRFAPSVPLRVSMSTVHRTAVTLPCSSFSHPSQRMM